VAVLAFYRGQERALRLELRHVTKQHDEHRLFTWHGVTISLCTVDRFQGHEADLVLLSFANAHASNFLESENRLNVALTRARYGLRIFGNRVQLARSKAPLLAALQRLPNSVRWQGGVQ
jgi:superfamily I DNA and/or RNA helicase